MKRVRDSLPILLESYDLGYMTLNFLWTTLMTSVSLDLPLVMRSSLPSPQASSSLLLQQSHHVRPSLNPSSLLVPARAGRQEPPRHQTAGLRTFGGVVEEETEERPKVCVMLKGSSQAEPRQCCELKG